MCGKAGIDHLPKAHLFIHLSTGIAKSGNPKFHTTYEDEALNHVLKEIASTVHPMRFAEGVFDHILVAEQVNIL